LDSIELIWFLWFIWMGHFGALIEEPDPISSTRCGGKINIVL